MSENLNLKTITTIDPSPFKHLCVTIGELPSTFVESMSYYECLAWLVSYLENTVIPAVNQNGEACAELQEKFIELKDFVDNYFDNLDVQEEINNKLDEMAEDGTLQEIITTYIQANVAWTFDTVADMKLAENLVNGSFAQTLGFHNINDNGGGIYKITDTGTANEMNIIAVGSLYATLINGKNIRQYGAVGDGIEDDTIAIQTAVNNVPHAIISTGTYRTTDSIVIPASHTLEGDNKELCVIKYYGVSSCIVLDGRFSTVKGLTIDADTSVSSTSKIGIAVRPDIAPSADLTITNNLIEDLVIRRFYKGVSLDNMWQVTIRNCIIVGATKGAEGNRNCYGICYESSGTVLANWSGSGNIIQSCYITNCSYALHFKGAWDVTVLDTIIEENYSSIYKNTTGRSVILINTWFEKQEARAELLSPIMIIGGRRNVLANSTELEFPMNMNNVYYISETGTNYNIYNQRISSNEPQAEATLSGIKSFIPHDGSKTKITTLKAYTSHGNVVNQTTQEVSDNNLTGEISLNTYGTAGGNGKTYTTFEFSSGQTNGNAVDIAIRPVFEIDKSGNIKCPDSTETVDVGTQEHVYRRGWFKWLTLKGANGNYYNLSIDNSGNITATQIE